MFIAVPERMYRRGDSPACNGTRVGRGRKRGADEEEGKRERRGGGGWRRKVGRERNEGEGQREAG